MDGFLVSAATGALVAVLEKLATVLGDEYKLFKGVRREVKSITAELEAMHAFLLKMSEEENPDPQDKVWAKAVRELSYDIEDSLDEFMLSVDHKLAKPDGFIEKCKNLVNFTKTSARRRIAKEIEDLKAQVEDVAAMNARYKIPGIILKASNATVDRRALAVFEDASKLVGISRPKREIMELLKQKDVPNSEGGFHLDDKESKHRKVISICGSGGLGKTTLANKVYEEIKGQYDCCAFVSVSRNPDMANVLRNILSQASQQPFSNTEAADIQQLIRTINYFLKDKRYLIVVDDVWKEDTWETISYALVKNSQGSRVITTTRIHGVAESCSSSQHDHVHFIRPLDPNESKILFLRRIFGSELKCPKHLIKVSEKILKQCDGLPLAIISISGLLANKPQSEDQWERVRKSIGRAIEKDPNVKRMMQILSLSYYDLPPHLKSCLLYFSTFPEDIALGKKYLIRRWIAEGFIREEHGYSLYDLGERSFNELINRSLIQAWKINEYWEVTACRVHDTILDFVVSKSAEENFITILGDGHQKPNPGDKVRRLVYHAGRENVSTLVGLDLSHVRSLAVEEYSVGLPSFGDFRFLRILDLGGCVEIEDHHLASIGKSIRLKYLNLRGTGVRTLPEQIGEVQNLETLILDKTHITKLPAIVVRFRRLIHLIVGKDVKLPDRIGSMVALQELYHVNVFKQSIEFMQEISKLTDPRDVRLCLSYDDSMKCGTEGSGCKEYMDNILSSLYKLVYLHSLCIDIDPRCAHDFSLDSEDCDPRGLQTLTVGNGFISRVPNWMESLVILKHLTLYVKEFEMEDMLVLGRLPALVFLRLVAHESCFPGRSFSIGRNQGFECLKRFEFGCAIPPMFEDGAMPNLGKLILLFNAVKTHLFADDGCFPLGIQHLGSLDSVECVIHKGPVNTMSTPVSEMSCSVLKSTAAAMKAVLRTDVVYSAMSAIRADVSANPRLPKLDLRETNQWSIEHPISRPRNVMRVLQTYSMLTEMRDRLREIEEEVLRRCRHQPDTSMGDCSHSEAPRTQNTEGMPVQDDCAGPAGMFELMLQGTTHYVDLSNFMGTSTEKMPSLAPLESLQSNISHDSVTFSKSMGEGTTEKPGTSRKRKMVTPNVSSGLRRSQRCNKGKMPA